jgi:hypothetical protein
MPVAQMSIEDELLIAMEEAKRNYREGSEGMASEGPFIPAWWMHNQLSHMSSTILNYIKSQDYTSDEEKHVQYRDIYHYMKDIKDAYTILAYSYFTRTQQYFSRDTLNIRHGWQHLPPGKRSRFELPPHAVEALKLITNLAGVAYDGEQTVFDTATIYNQPEPFASIQDLVAHHEQHTKSTEVDPSAQFLKCDNKRDVDGVLAF